IAGGIVRVGFVGRDKGSYHAGDDAGTGTGELIDTIISIIRPQIIRKGLPFSKYLGQLHRKHPENHTVVIRSRLRPQFGP
ncbi:MAG: hypothetical protein ACK5YR_01520, partial [Pirellula sp.]